MTKVLIVDDEPGILKSTELLLKELGFEALTATEKDDIVPLMHKYRPDVLLQDVRMPGLDIRHLLQTIRSDPDVGETPILLFSASLDLGDSWHDLGATGIVEKPFRPDQLVAAIQDALDGAHEPVAAGDGSGDP